MAERLLKTKKRRITAKQAAEEKCAPKKVVLVGTYAGGQLEEWPGYYPYPLYGDDKLDAEACGKVNEIWLFKGTKEPKYFAAECLGVKTRDELKALGYPAKGKGHGDGAYLLFKIVQTYAPANASAALAASVESVIVRTKDFARRSPKVAKQLKAYLESSDRTNDALANQLPSIVTKLPPEVLRVCEAAVQMEFMSYLTMNAKSNAGTDEKVRVFSSTQNVLHLPDYKYLNENALEFMQGMPDNTIQLVLTSPPYNVGKEYEAHTSIRNYLEGMRELLKQIVRIVKPGGSVCWQVGNYVENGEVFPLDIYYYSMFKELGLILRNRIIWHFGHGLHCKNRFSGRYETILWFTKGDEYTFNLDDVRIPSKYPGKKYYKGAKKGQLSGNPLGKNPEDVWVLKKVAEDWDGLIWDIPNVKSNHPEKVDHPCQFPIELVERCVLALTRQGDIVFDPFAGVGSSIIGALKNGRIGYGTELEKKYVDIGLSRIELLSKGALKMRPVTQEIFEAEKAGSLSRIPEEWIKKGYTK